MAPVIADKDTRATPREVICALTDFSDRRLELWPNIDRKYYKAHQISNTSADVTEGGRGVWERTHYDWSESGKVRIRVEDSNAFRPGSSYWIYSVEPRPDGGSHVHLEFRRTPRNAKGALLSALFTLAVVARGPEVAADWATLRSPETYLRQRDIERFASPGGAVLDQRRAYAAPARLGVNEWALVGAWTLGAALLNEAGGRIAYRFHARDVNLVLDPAARGSSIRFRVLVDGQPPGTAHGSDVDEQGRGTVTDQRLYQLI